MKIKQLYTLVLGLVLLSCSEDKGNYDYVDVNEIKVGNVKNNYSCYMGEELVIEPIIEQAVPSEVLEYSWILKGRQLSEDIVLSNEKTFNLSLTEENFSYGKNMIVLSVMDKSNSQDIIGYLKFNITITSKFSYGYYFLTSDGDDESTLSYFSWRNISENGEFTSDAKLLHTKYIEDKAGEKYFIGKSPQAIKAFQLSLGDGAVYSHLYIVSKESEYPCIQTDNLYFKLNSYQNNSSFYEGGSYEFNPTQMLVTVDGIRNKDNQGVFLSNNEFVQMIDGRLYRPAVHKKDYKWKGAYIHMMQQRVSHAYAHDELTDKIYLVRPEMNDPITGTLGDNNAFDAVYDIVDSPLLTGKTIIGCQDANYTLEEHIGKKDKDGNPILDKNQKPIIDTIKTLHYGVNLCLSSATGVDFFKYYIPQSNTDYKKYPPHFNKSNKHSVETDKFNSNSKAIFTAKEWYISSDNNIYILSEQGQEIRTFVSLPEDLGEITCFKETIINEEAVFVVTTYNPNSTEEYKGSVAFINRGSKKQSTYKNVIHKCVDLTEAIPLVPRQGG